MKFDLTTLKPVIESELYAVYTLGQINENTWKGVRLNKKTLVQEEVKVVKKINYRVVDVIQKVR